MINFNIHFLDRWKNLIRNQNVNKSSIRFFHSFVSTCSSYYVKHFKSMSQRYHRPSQEKNKTSPQFVFYKQNQELVSQSIFFFLARHKSKLFSQPFCHSWSIGNEFCLTTYKYQGSKIWISYDTFIKTNHPKYEIARRYKKDK